MARKTLKQFHKELGWSTRIYTLLTIALAICAFIFDAWNTDWVLTVICALAIILCVESFAISFHRHPKTWRVIWWSIVLILLAVLLIGFTS